MTIQIKVTGPQGCGKSMMIIKLERTLKMNGFKRDMTAEREVIGLKNGAEHERIYSTNETFNVK